MDKRHARQRREYLYKKALEQKEKTIFERKQALKTAIDNGKSVPRDLRNDVKLQKDFVYDEAQEDPSVDDEYFRAGEIDPKILITTSRDPSSKLLQFSKEMKLMFPNSQRMNRGNYIIGDIVDACRKNDATDLIILHETRGKPDGMVVSHFPHGPTAYFTLHNVVLRHDVPGRKKVSEAYPHLIFEKFSSKLGKRAQNILKYLFPVPKEDSKRIMSFINDSDYISYRHHTYSRENGKIELEEIGPRFEMQLYQIKLGTVDITEADTEWVYRPYQRTAKKRDFL